jgi:hypothetical protein
VIQCIYTYVCVCIFTSLCPCNALSWPSGSVSRSCGLLWATCGQSGPSTSPSRKQLSLRKYVCVRTHVLMYMRTLMHTHTHTHIYTHAHRSPGRQRVCVTTQRTTESAWLGKTKRSRDPYLLMRVCMCKMQCSVVRCFSSHISLSLSLSLTHTTLCRPRQRLCI